MATIKGFYVTMRRETMEGVKVAWLLGPYDTHEAALGLVHTARDLAEKVDPRCAWEAFGTSSITWEAESLAGFPKGKLNGAYAATTEEER